MLGFAHPAIILLLFLSHSTAQAVTSVSFAIASADRIAGKVPVAVTLSFAPAAAIPVGGTIAIDYPFGFFDSSATPTIGASNVGSLSATCSAPANTSIVITTGGSSIPASAVFTVTITGFKMGPASAGGNVTVRTSSDGYSSQPVASGFIATAQAVTSVSFAIASADRIAGKVPVAVTLSFAPATAIPVGGTITIDYPFGFFDSSVTPTIIAFSSSVNPSLFLCSAPANTSIVIATAVGVIPASVGFTVTITGFKMGPASAGGNITVRTSSDVDLSQPVSSGSIGSPSPPFSPPPALPNASGTSDPSTFDGVFIGACAVSYGFKNTDPATKKQCTKSNGVCQQLFYAEYFDAGKGTGFPGATFYRGAFTPANMCVNAEGQALDAGSKMFNTEVNDMVLFSQGSYILPDDAVWFAFSKKPPSNATFSVLQPVKQWPFCSFNGLSGLTLCYSDVNALSRPNLQTQGSFLAHTDGTNYWEFGVLDSDLALLAPGIDPATGQNSGKLAINATPACDSSGRVTYQCYATKQAKGDADANPDTGGDVLGCSPFPRVCQTFPQPDKSGMITLTNPAYPEPMILNASKCLTTLSAFVTQSKTSDPNSILRDYLNSLSSCFNPVLTPCFNDAMSYLRACGCLDDDSLSSMIDTFCGDTGAGDASDGGFSAFAPSDDGEFNAAALDAFAKCADPDLAKELATRAADPDRYAEEPPPSDSLGQPLEPAPGGSTISEQVRTSAVVMCHVLALTCLVSHACIAVPQQHRCQESPDQDSRKL